jgi:ribosomal protein S18 acetylase RimI-like enzyme
MQIERVTKLNQKEVISFLSKYEDTAVFLLGNLAQHGPNLGLHANSGNYKLIRQNDKIISVFCLTRRGNLLVQSELTDSVFECIVESCKEDNIPIKGVIGDWEFANVFWPYLKEKKIIKKENFYSKEINYIFNLDNFKSFVNNDARLLEVDDYSTWKSLRLDYLVEQKLPHDLSDKELLDQFIGKCKGSMIWGLFKDSKLIAIAELNAKADALATVGGVYTAPQHRKMGYAKILMERLFFDCKNKLSLHKLIIFTGESKNLPAQKLYESLGCTKVGYMALFFGE